MAKHAKLESVCEGLCAQMLHVGPHSEELASIAARQCLLRANGLAPDGAHHGTYAGDPCQPGPDRLRTIVPQPVTANG